MANSPPLLFGISPSGVRKNVATFYNWSIMLVQIHDSIITSANPQWIQRWNQTLESSERANGRIYDGIERSINGGIKRVIEL